jgi:Protein of unknown function (DUF3551)
MRIILASAICLFFLLFLFFGSTMNTARADPYHWCAVFNMGDNAVSCYFVTREQCQASLSGMGGSCEPNRFYDGRPEGPQDSPAEDTPVAPRPPQVATTPSRR